MNCIYVVLDEFDRVKIGVSKDVDKRIKFIFDTAGLTVQALCTMNVPEAYMLEAAVHAKLKDKQIKGEWFDVDYADAFLLVKDMAEIPMYGGTADNVYPICPTGRV